MVAFDPEADLSDDLAFQMVSKSPVTLFWRRQVLDETTTWLGTHGYQVTVLDASSWSAQADLHHAIAAALHFPDYYGRNLDALNDCLRDVVAQTYGWAPDTTGLALVFLGYDNFARQCPDAGEAVLDILADHSRVAALLGRRLMCLVQSNDPDIELTPVGATPVTWNDAEWLESRRHPQ